MPSEGKAEMKRRRASRETSLFVRLFQDDGPAAAALGTTNSIPLAEIIPIKKRKHDDQRIFHRNIQTRILVSPFSTIIKRLSLLQPVSNIQISSFNP